MGWLAVIILGVVEGITEFLPVSSTGHLSVAEKLLGLSLDAPDVTAFTAIIQVGAILAAIVYFRADIIRLALGWCKGLFHQNKRDDDYRLGWAVIIGSVPIGVVGLLFEQYIETTLRSLWVVAGALLAWSVVMWFADRYTASRAELRSESSLGILDGLLIGLAQCIALIPGVSRSGATISAGLFRGIDRPTATRWSFFLGIPALTASGVLQAFKAADEISAGVGWLQTGVATAVSFVVAYVSIAWLLKFVASNRFTGFVLYRVCAGCAVAMMLLVRVITAQ
ncbi:MAG: undecaprenyl-diphosphate phosphatase [Propionibacteriaceae bacterium]|jgi:undecaprenyl-diphosphatase|nr:undecaprenyl-diphosphate phosphatase [Propionibacteriaceae bacterium]